MTPLAWRNSNGTWYPRLAAPRYGLLCEAERRALTVADNKTVMRVYQIGRDTAYRWRRRARREMEK